MANTVNERDCEAAWATTIKHRDRVHDIASNIEDEGGRCYFGSTNDADDLRNVAAMMDDIRWHISEGDNPVDWMARVEQLGAELDAERTASARLNEALAQKDRAMGVLFDRMKAAGVDYSDLIS